MRYLALVCDYDGTLAEHGTVAAETIAALERLLASGRRLILLTGRTLDDLSLVFSQLHLFERVVAENGAWLYRPSSREQKALGDPPPEVFIEGLRKRGVAPLAVGRVIVATREPYESAVLEVIRELGLELQVIFNKGAVMVLPAGVNKATGLAAALRELGISAHNVVGVGDAENDHAFFKMCECAVSVANGLAMLQERADFVTRGENGAGVRELIDEVLATDLREREPRLSRHHILLGTGADGSEVKVSPYGTNLLLAGSSGSGKSTLATALLERLAEQGYQFCVIDPEGDYEIFEGGVVLGNSQRAPGADEVLQLLDVPEQNAVVNLLGLPLEDRPLFFAQLLPRLQEFRLRMGRPHWIIVDEAHHLLPPPWDPATLAVTPELRGMMFITVHPDQVAPAVLSAVDTIIAVGEAAESTLKAFCRTLDQPLPQFTSDVLQPGEALVWERAANRSPYRIRVARGRADRLRHRRKYAEGELGPDKSFYFRGPQGKLNLRAQNLQLFMQLAEGVDDVTWQYHLRRGDYSRWFLEAIKDNELATIASGIEQHHGLTAAESRARIKAAIEQHYTQPSGSTPAATRTP